MLDERLKLSVPLPMRRRQEKFVLDMGDMLNVRVTIIEPSNSCFLIIFSHKENEGENVGH